MHSQRLDYMRFLRSARGIAAAGAMLVLSVVAGPATAQQQVTMETLLDRIQIEDLLTRYYYDMSLGEAHKLADYFTEDALLDVDGTIARGREEIGRLYGRPPGGTPDRFDETYKPRGNPLKESQ